MTLSECSDLPIHIPNCEYSAWLILSHVLVARHIPSCLLSSTQQVLVNPGHSLKAKSKSKSNLQLAIVKPHSLDEFITFLESEMGQEPRN
jgi:hypothetical protein